jgi:hypothetical protein
MDQPARRKTLTRKILRITLRSILFLFLFIVLVFLLILTPPVQNVLRKKAVTYLEKKLKTHVAIGRIYVGLPKKLVMEDIYIEDRQKDTLLAAGSLKMNIDIMKLLFKGRLDISKTEIKNSTAKIKRQLPDTVFNYQFIVDAFAPTDSTGGSTDTSASSLSLGTIVLDKTRLVYNDVITGSDMETWIDHLDTRIDEFDPQRLNFNVPQTNISGVAARIYQVKPLARPEPEIKDMIEARQPSPLQLAFSQLNLENFRLEYRNDVSATYAVFDLGKLNIKPNTIDLDNRVLDLKDASLENSTISLRLGKKEQARVVAKEVKQEVKSQAAAGWHIKLGSIALRDDSLRFDNDNETRTKRAV